MEAGLERVIYLGGLGEESEDLSEHLESRHETGRILAESGPPLLEFRAAMVVSADSASYTMLTDLVNRLPAMIVPRWVDTPSQPIAVDDVLVVPRRGPRDAARAGPARSSRSADRTSRPTGR